MDKSTTLPLNTTAASFQPSPADSTGMVMNLDATTDDNDVSREALLMRAAELGPGPRLSLDNIGMAPTDPILAQKGLPQVAERRARFRKFVKVAVGLCAGFALFATAATALSSSKAPASSAQASSNAATTHTDTPAEAVNPKEPLEVAATAKAPSQPAPAARHGRAAKRR